MVVSNLNKMMFFLSSLTRACKLKNDVIQSRIPIRKSLLSVIVWTVGRIFCSEQPFLICLYRALFLTTYFSLFRVGEVTRSTHRVCACDVQIGQNKNKLIFILRSSKTHNQSDKPQIIKISAIMQNRRHTLEQTTHCESDVFCPFQMLKQFISMCGQYVTDEEPFFIFRDHSPVLPSHFRWVLKKCITLIGLDPKLYCLHGMHAGRASDLLHMGVSVETIKKLGRWCSSSVYTYLCT